LAKLARPLRLIRHPQAAQSKKCGRDFHCHAQYWHAWPRFGACRPAKMSMSRNQSPTTFGKAKKWSREPTLPKIVQVGTQSRSSPGLKEAVEWVQKGIWENPGLARTLLQTAPQHRQNGRPAAVPLRVDYDLWCGPAPMTPPRRRHFHYDWHWFWNYGAATRQPGIHEMDVARWFLVKNLVASSLVHRRAARLRG